MTDIGGYVNMAISDQWVDCHNCEESVRVEIIENLTDIAPREYGIVLRCDPCPKCGFVNVYEYLANDRYSKELTQEATNEHFEQIGDERGGVEFYNISKTKWYFHNEEEEE
tara:strand:- start:330 stop:662 length:333 start_codon:yes stop_codon:yes gene_type:complete